MWYLRLLSIEQYWKNAYIIYKCACVISTKKNQIDGLMNDYDRGQSLIDFCQIINYNIKKKKEKKYINMKIWEDWNFDQLIILYMLEEL